jgi:hypothetical protein
MRPIRGAGGRRCRHPAENAYLIANTDLRQRRIEKIHLQDTLAEQALDLGLGDGRNEVKAFPLKILDLRGFDHTSIADEGDRAASNGLPCQLVRQRSRCLVYCPGRFRLPKDIRGHYRDEPSCRHTAGWLCLACADPTAALHRFRARADAFGLKKPRTFGGSCARSSLYLASKVTSVYATATDRQAQQTNCFNETEMTVPLDTYL